MQLPRRLIPPVSGLVAFEATARNGSFSKAAEDLALSQGAVSKRVRQLEEVLGVVLISRGSQPLHLTRFGRSYLPRVQTLLSQMERSTRDLLDEAEGARRTVTVSSDSAFAMGWLLPRSGEFVRAHPEVSINLVSEGGPTDRAVDVTVRCGPVASAGPEEVVLCVEDLIPVVKEPPRAGDDAETMANRPLLHLASRPGLWDEWFAVAGVRRIAASDGPVFDHVALLVAAAVGGQGVALLPRMLVRDELRAGRLRQVLAWGALDSAYILGVEPEASGLPQVRAVRDWLVDTSRGTDRADGSAAGSAPEAPALQRVPA